MRHRSALPRILALGLAVCTASFGLAAGPAGAVSGAASAAPPSVPAPSGAAVAPAGASESHTAAKPSPAGPPVAIGAATSLAVTSPAGPAGPDAASAVTAASSAAPAGTTPSTPSTQSCTAADFGSRGGAKLAAYVKTSTTDCLNTLYALTGSDAAAVFKESQMTAVANAFVSTARNYRGDDSSGIWQLSLFLTAGYYVQYNNAAAVGSYGSALADPVQNGLDAFFSARHSSDVSAANGNVLGNVITLSDSADLQARYISVYKRVLNGYKSSYDAFPSMDAAVNAVFTPIYRGHFFPAYIAAVTADPSLIDALNSFALNNTALLPGANYALDTNAAAEAVRFLDTPALQAKVRPLAAHLLAISPLPGPNGPLWVRVAVVVDYVDGAECGTFGVCDYTDTLKAAVLPTTYPCGTTRTILAQAMTAADLNAACTSLQGEDAFYHGLVKDGGPIAGQYDTNVRLAVFATKWDYTVYSTALFGNDTDNGGETLSGDITDPANQPISVMYVKFPGDGFPASVWNLNHEYTHLLQGEFDMKGTFDQEISVPDIWWVEGEAEYVSYAYRGLNNTQAIGEASQHAFPLSTLFQTTYDNTTTDRTYTWGYLAVRYMIEKHPADVQAMLAKFRVGDWAGGYAVYNAIGTKYDADFDAWLDVCAAGACLVPGAPTAAFTMAPDGLSVHFSDVSTDTGSPLNFERWSYGDNTISTTDGPNPTHTFPAAGTYTIALTVDDAKGLSSTYAQNVTVTGPSGPPPCPSANPQAMDRNCSRADQSETAGDYDSLWIYLPAGQVTLHVATTGGSGNADLYYDPDTWATKQTHTAKSTGGGNDQSITVTNKTAGYRYISLYAVTSFSGVSVSTQY
ncbi:Peptidase M9A collagenase domain protein [Catenulispora acidiphila DSM 44928]|uniref:microbial collagenase n=1 Tax=Catenulispora acidiphila (strain DSM 44928 / JCM 14897 / NBRC 102108 / NRRL B-24433 / ID139908) TaxID=479433 RepID=C7Q6W8_CATAD|nr:collagenase [Catenulispora acidiphila]ACU75981.1 Peptidase M9A collagenase domain protein [Catenulispora acidiphila DSM 44928]